jgi:hypothetical protein
MRDGPIGIVWHYVRACVAERGAFTLLLLSFANKTMVMFCRDDYDGCV